MSDFTKDELEELKRCCNWVINCKDTHYTTTTYGLPEKIQSMIDNYCEHTPSDAHYEQFRWQLCRKCGVQYK